MLHLTADSVSPLCFDFALVSFDLVSLLLYNLLLVKNMGQVVIKGNGGVLFAPQGRPRATCNVMGLQQEMIVERLLNETTRHARIIFDVA